MSSAIQSTTRERVVGVAPPRADAVPPRQPPPSRNLARVAGVLFITATVTGVIATGLLHSVVGGAGDLVKISGHQDRVIAGATFQLLAAFACAGIGIALYPAVRRHDAALALGSAGFRLIEGTLYVVGAIGTLLLLKLAQEHALAADPSSAYFQTTGALLRSLRDDAAVTAALAFYLGAGMYYYAFYRSRLIPRWLAGWGLAGVALGAVSGFCVLFRVTAFMSPFQVALNMPIGVQEMVLAIWLIVRGFSSSSLAVPPVSEA